MAIAPAGRDRGPPSKQEIRDADRNDWPGTYGQQYGAATDAGKGHQGVVYDRHAEAVKALQSEGAVSLEDSVCDA
jgi:hypothetical protein